MPKVIEPEEHFRQFELLSIDDSIWAKIKSVIPGPPLQADADAKLRDAIRQCCSWFLSRRLQVEEARATAAAMRRPGKGQLAPLERLAKGLRMAADGWKDIEEIRKEIGEFHDDRRSDLRRFADAEMLAQDAERRLARIRARGKPVTVADPFREFVRKVARCCRDAGLNPTISGGIYEGAPPSWFQRLLAMLDKELLANRLVGLDQNNKQFERDPRAFYAEITKALQGDRKPGKAQKQIT
jgi:hypothetical protein